MAFGTMPDESKKPVVAAGSASALTGWQFTSCGSVPGISGNVDLDIRYTDDKNVAKKSECYQKPEFTLIECLDKIGVDATEPASGRKIV